LDIAYTSFLECADNQKEVKDDDIHVIMKNVNQISKIAIA
jgi:2-isopropylmalate synthase